MPATSPVNPSRHGEGEQVTRIGMAIDPERLHVMERRRRRWHTIGSSSLAAFAVLLLVANVLLVGQRGASTPIDEAALLAEFAAPTAADAVATGEFAPVDTASSASAPEAPAEAVEGGEGTDATPPSGTQSPTGADGQADPPASDAPESAPATAPATPPGSSQESAPVAPTAPTFALPGDGVYAYATEGYETVSLGGARHDYPERTFAIIEAQGGCEWTFDHRILEEKRTVNTFCHDGPQQRVLRYDGWITFFGSTAESHYTCEGARADRRDQPGARHTSECTDGSATTSDVTTYVGMQEMVIGGVKVQAMAYRIETKVTGSVTGTSSQAVWLRPSDGLPLRIERDTDTSAHEFGAQVDYVEHAVFELESLNPRS